MIAAIKYTRITIFKDISFSSTVHNQIMTPRNNAKHHTDHSNENIYLYQVLSIILNTI